MNFKNRHCARWRTKKHEGLVYLASFGKCVGPVTKEGFTYHANIDRSYMGGVERGERNLSFKKLCAIAQTLGCDLAALTRGIASERARLTPELT
jgi:transcriptional regulator with XRE-family HTH domain